MGIACAGDGCGLSHRLDCVPADYYVADDSDTPMEVLFVVDAPASGKALIGRTDEFLLKRILARLAPDTTWGISSLIRCSPCTPAGDPRRPKADEFQRCRKFLNIDIEQQRPRVVVGLGEVAAAHIGAPAERGHWCRTDRYIAVNTWHPETVGRSKKMVPMFYRDIELAFRLARGHVPADTWGRLGRSRLLRTPVEVREVATLIANLPGYCAVDVETHNLNKRYGNALAMVQFAWSDDDAVCIPLHHPQNPMTPDEIQETRQILRDLFVEPTKLRGWLAHFGKFEQTQIGRDILTDPNGVTETFRNAPMLDTGAFAYLLDENASNFPHSYALKSLARSKLAFYHYDDATLMARSSGSLIDLPLESPAPVGDPAWVPNLTDYGGMDAYVTYRLFQALCGEADQQDYLVPALRLLRRFFSPVFGLLSVIERNGFWANLDHLRTIKDPQTSPIVGRLREIDTVLVPQFPSAQRANEKLALKQSGGTPPLFGDTPWVMDLQKDAHVRAWLVDECGLEPLGYGKAGFASVDSAFFEHHRDHEEVALVEERRGLAKLASAYLKQITGYIDPSFAHKTPVGTARQQDCRDGRIRCDIHLTSTTTGRASAANPNMQQQVRSDTEAKAAIKNIFQAEQPGLQESFQIDFTKGPPRARSPRPPTNALVQLDFMANEVRWWGIMSGCPNLAKAFNEGKAARDAFRHNPTPELRDAAKIGGDIHKQTASLMFGVPLSEVDKQRRTASKSIVFGALYGRGVHALAAQIHRDVDEAQELLDKFSGAFPVGWEWIQRQPELARQRWYVESPIGRRRRLYGFLVERSNLDDMSKPDRQLLGETKRMAMNSGIQGVASDASFIGSALFSEHIQRHRLPWLIQNVVHDSCVYQVPLAQVEESIAVAEQMFTINTMRYMEQHWGVRFNCPIEVEFEIGLRWGALMEWDFTAPSMQHIIRTLRAMEV